MIQVLRQRNFALLWFAGLISMIGDWVLFIALPIHTYTLTHSSLATGIMFMAGTLPLGTVPLLMIKGILDIAAGLLAFTLLYNVKSSLSVPEME